jgi:hypothetical protein
MSKILNRIRRWNMWRKDNINAWWYKILVLLGICHSPTFTYYFTILDAFNRKCKSLNWEDVELQLDDDSLEIERKIIFEGFEENEEDTNE